ncbi:hypothetical protein IEN85_04770 [Pelagicoccus sp. NFK12]|uniref:HTH luxR-type domain-containing protein n=1 Tax=Pelagicoccus enzymogenes TaxID=2773457 RepID=A0A927F5J6_9BACT|nr:LuxR C-terminal-related transcriptional regulator [Pelagicoccus enzymogenes]MBD5778793.1 hypothetical protein [Pelagicoccus enzymogenes]
MSYEIRESDFRVLRDFGRHLSLLLHRDELSECTLLYLNRLIPSDCVCWNEWTPAFTFLKESHVTESHRSRIGRLIPSLVENLKHHPVITHVGWHRLLPHPYRLSDYQCDAFFRDNPLYQEVYRHLEARYQLAFPFCTTSTTEFLLILNRRYRDFTEHERQLLQTAGQIVAPFLHRMHAKEIAQRKAEIVAVIMEQTYGLLHLDTLSPGELLLLKALAAGQSVSEVATARHIRRDTLSRQLSAAREKLKLTSNKELLATLRSDSPLNTTDPK